MILRGKAQQTPVLLKKRSLKQEIYFNRSEHATYSEQAE